MHLCVEGPPCAGLGAPRLLLHRRLKSASVSMSRLVTLETAACPQHLPGESVPGVGAMLTGCLWGPGAPSLLLVAAQVDTNLGPIWGSSGARVAAGLGRGEDGPGCGCGTGPLRASHALCLLWQVSQSRPLTEVWRG